MVSEDSDQSMPGLLAIHRLSDFRDIRQTRTGPVKTEANLLNTTGELFEIPLLR